MDPRVRVVVGEDEPLVREGIVRVLERAGFEVLAAVAEADDVVRKVGAHRPDVAVVDIRMPRGMNENGLRAALAIRAAHPDVGVLVLSQFLEDRYVLELVGDRPEGVGYLLKEKVSDVGVLSDAVHRIAAGGSALDADVIALLVSRRRAAGPLDELTPRELDVLKLMAQGRSNRGIAEELVVSIAAVERHVTGIFTKLGLHDSDLGQHRRVLAVLAYLHQ
ncbi:MAG TPA: response regulator transcription factor [Conexibacter sp.]|jgi:DNA-binding NarL/FixJ family response regulator